MIGHCGGLRPSQRIGDYVLAHAYLRDDRVLDEMLPPEIPIPAIAEVQLALAKAAHDVLGGTEEEFKRRLPSVPTVTTDNRNRDMRISHTVPHFPQLRQDARAMETVRFTHKSNFFP